MKPARGQTWRIPLATTSEGQLAKDVEITVERVTRLTCGCDRIETTRPGPASGVLAGSMHVMVNRCTWHAANDHQPEAVPVDSKPHAEVASSR